MTTRNTETEAVESAPRTPPGLRVTVTMEVSSEEGMAWALGQGFKFAAERWISVTVSRKNDPSTRVSCRTTKLRKRK
jgi:hypothetical protein